MKSTKWIKALGACSVMVVSVGSMASAMPMHKMDGSKMSGSKMAMGDMSSMKAKNAQMLIQTLSEEKTEIASLAAQQAAFKKMGGRENLKIASMYGRWIAEHKAGGPMFMKLIKQNGGDPMAAKILKAPPLGDRATMLMATHKDHEAAVATSRMRYSMTNSAAIKMAMSKRVKLASKHLAQMKPFHKEMMMGGMKMNGGKMDGAMNGSKMAQATMCPHCNVKMKDGKCPECGMTMAQMKADMKK